MKSCAACGLPAPDESLACAFCGQLYAQPANFSLLPTATSFTWIAGETELAEARIEDGIWRIYSPNSEKPLISLLAIRRDNKFTAALLDRDLSRVASVVIRVRDPKLEGPGSHVVSNRFVAVVNDELRTVLVIHGDGPTGFHFVNRLGDVVALASPREGFVLSGFDAIVTGRSYEFRPLELFSILLSLILAQLSGPDTDFADIDHLCIDESNNLEESGSEDI
ncbi:MAG: hypothetical protein M0019_01685 [Actinomycetota bacterium]|nr:hypothetical protein [Actinomycetota bacterium]